MSKEKMTKKYYIMRVNLQISVRESEHLYIRKNLLERKIALPQITPEQYEQYMIELNAMKTEIAEYKKIEKEKADALVEKGKYIYLGKVNSPTTGINYNYMCLKGTKFEADITKLPEAIRDQLEKYERSEKNKPPRVELVEEQVEDVEFIQTKKA